MKQIEIIVMPNGETRVTTRGFAGSNCQNASRFLERVLGRRSLTQRTSEFYSTDVKHTSRTQERS
jgi:hypothetical protein